MILIQTDKDSLLKPLQAVTGIVERRHTLPILSNVLVESQNDHIAFTATDLEIQVKADSFAVTMENEFAITVSAKKLQDILRALPDQAKVTLEWKENKLQVKSSKSRFNLQTLPSEDFPKLTLASESPAIISLPQQTLKHLLNQVQYAMAQQDIRYYLNGMLLVVSGTEIKLIATDGHRLSFASAVLEESVTADQEVILPRKTALELMRLLTGTEDKVNIEIAKNQVRAQCRAQTR